MTYFLGLDIGTTNIKSVVYDTDTGNIAKVVSKPTPVYHPKDGWSEHDPEVIWSAVLECIYPCTEIYPITALGISSMAEAGLPIGNDGKPLYPIIAWYDQRCMEEVAWWEKNLSNIDLHAITGQRVNPSFSANKILWLKSNFPESMSKLWKWLSLPDYILFKLTGELATDYSIASRTLLFDQVLREWSPRILELAGLCKEQLPQPYSGGTFVGWVKPDVAEISGLRFDTKCVLGGHDHLCAAFASGAYKPGQIADSSGTSEAVLMVTDKFHTGKSFADQAYACYAHVIHDCYVIKAGLKSSGSAIHWLINSILGNKEKSNGKRVKNLMLLAEKDIGKRVGPFWLPHWLGAGSPESDRFSRAALIGIRLEHEPQDLYRGMLESLSFWLRQNIEELEVITEHKSTDVRLLGGTANIQLLSKLKANVMNNCVQIPMIEESAALGAALLAGIGAGIYKDAEEALNAAEYDIDEICPETAITNWYDRLYKDIYCRLYDSIKDINHDISKLTYEKGLLY